jgi:O-acetyl-ADP-ribose deacetylase (regulator of RNase III)
MTFQIKFIDINEDIVNTFVKIFENIPNITCEVSDVVKFTDVDNVAFVSPANSIGFMDGGIDYAYSRIMFPNIENQVKKEFAKYGLITKYDRYYLPIGSAIVLPIDNNKYMISAPTMWLPQDVTMTKNAYHAFYAVLCAIDKSQIEIDTLICSPFCTGYGCMSAIESANQMLNAYNYFIKNGRCDDGCIDKHIFFLEPNKYEQPAVLENYEFF